MPERQKCRKTTVHRFHGSFAGKKTKYWVDVELLYNSSYAGRQWPGIDVGNQAGETILQMAANDGAEIVRVYMNPDSKKDEDSVRVQTIGCSTLATRSQYLKRSFSNTGKNTCRQETKRRISFNDIASKYLDKDKNPPENPKKYKDAVRKTKDKCDLFLDVARTKTATHDRGKGRYAQRVKTSGQWGEGKGSLDGESADVRQKGHDPIRLSPTMTVINFGPDVLAVQFEGEKKSPGAAAAVSPVASMFAGIAANLMGGVP